MSVAALFRFASRTDVALMVLGVVAALLHGTLTPAGIVVLGDAFTTGTAASGGAAPLSVGTREELSRLAAKLGILGATAFVAAFVQVATFTVTSTAQGARIRARYFQALLRQEMGWLDEHDAGELATRVASDVDVMVVGMGAKAVYAAQHLSTFVTGLTVSFVVGWRLALVVLATVPVLFGSAAAVARSVGRSTAISQASYTAAGGVAAEALRLIRTVAVFGGEAVEAARYTRHLRAAAADAERRWHVAGLGAAATMLVTKAAYALAFWYGARLVRAGDLSAGATYTVFFATVTGSMGLGHALPAVNAVAAARAAAPRIYALIDRASAIDPLDGGAGRVLDRVEGELSIEGVGFGYPAGGGARALDGFSATLRRGQTLALVGPSGCGKVRGG